MGTSSLSSQLDVEQLIFALISSDLVFIVPVPTAAHKHSILDRFYTALHCDEFLKALNVRSTGK